MLKAFISYQYHSNREALVTNINNLLRTLNVESIDGRHIKPASELSKQVQNTIANCDFLVSLRPDSEHNSYLDLETNFASHSRKPVLIIATNTTLPTEVCSDFYLVVLQKGEFQSAIEIVQAVNNIKVKRTLAIEPVLAQHSAEDEIDREQWTSAVRQQLREIRHLFDCLNYQGALAVAEKLYSTHPDCWRAGIAKSATLVFLHRFEEAEQILDELIGSFAGNGRALSHAYQNKAWILLNQVDKDEKTIANAIDYLKNAIIYEPRFILYKESIFKFLLPTNRMQEAENLLIECLKLFSYARKDFQNEVNNRGAEFITKLAKSTAILDILFPKE
jgi:tetratricopeptide (TPR) repeat protein